MDEKTTQTTSEQLVEIWRAVNQIKWIMVGWTVVGLVALAGLFDSVG